MTKKTLPVIIVAISAPVWMSAPRPEKTSVKTQLVSDDIAEADNREQRLVVAERRSAEQVIDDPAERQRDDADQRRLPRLERHDGRIDEEESRLPV